MSITTTEKQTSFAQTLIQEKIFIPPSAPRASSLPWLPPSWVPYGELARLHKPAGILYIYFPYLFGSLFAACISAEVPSPRQMVLPNVLLLSIAFVIRSIGCTWNDYVDRDLDKHVDRCHVRPLARGAVAPSAALLFMMAQYFVLFAFAGVTAPESLPYLIPVVLTGTFYPYAKRITHYAQLVLGISLSMGTLVGCTVTGVGAIDFSSPFQRTGISLLALMASYVVWTMIYDTIYALQDLESDKKIGNMAMSIKFEENMAQLLYFLSVVMVVLLITTGYFMNASAFFYVFVAVTGLILYAMVSSINLDDSKDCWWWFVKGGLMISSSLTGMLMVEYLARAFL
ncbi:uncharacterized protein JN550_010187 [Neoarthrinium moseri]|uniref:uncharacterized protein n=1 Tax=Neoarthrinium moseri TaxID=1658444 RepID=UPI001FDD873E|nr:uncharacterized protein JN550_010187 [Neoarthrinium moseri]KAI1862662.1 hypothetical protein JN550_010187 [Neoarthrinium moseri]